ncbi:MAG: CAP domain-containing protein [Endozoicomonadaceae bacterium]|nr:CAP domain-containing protein [Endozoicomonadaceae bacterium]
MCFFLFDYQRFFIFLCFLNSLLYCNIALCSSEYAMKIIHEAREKNGLSQLDYSDQLSQIAKSHASYLAINHQCSHIQSAHLNFFSGVHARNRAKVLDYYPTILLENVYCGHTRDWFHAISDLMTGIYHRLTFLSYDINTVGYFLDQTAQSTALSDSALLFKFVFELSYKPKVFFCTEIDFKKTATHSLFNYGLIDPVEPLQALSQPDLVVYPWPNQTSVPVVFTDQEEPDPTPTLTISGMPISVQFNPNAVVTVLSFKLTNVQDKSQIVSLWALNASNDVQKKIKKNEYAWFPVKPLKRDTRYQVSLEYALQVHKKTKKMTKVWFFETEKNPFQNITLLQKNENHLIYDAHQPIYFQIDQPQLPYGAWINTIECSGCQHDCHLHLHAHDIFSFTTQPIPVTCSIQLKHNKQIMQVMVKPKKTGKNEM